MKGKSLLNFSRRRRGSTHANPRAFQETTLAGRAPLRQLACHSHGVHLALKPPPISRSIHCVRETSKRLCNGALVDRVLVDRGAVPDKLGGVVDTVDREHHQRNVIDQDHTFASLACEAQLWVPLRKHTLCLLRVDLQPDRLGGFVGVDVDRRLSALCILCNKVAPSVTCAEALCQSQRQGTRHLITTCCAHEELARRNLPIELHLVHREARLGDPGVDGAADLLRCDRRRGADREE
eukprot:7642838-Pyramimonas_sp.AAC.2